MSTLKNDLLLRVDHTVISAVLFLMLLAATEIGVRIGRFARRRADDASRMQINALEAATLGVLGLFLAFTFAMSAGRYDTRRQLTVLEANAIGTAYLRASILTQPYADDVRSAIRDFVQVRLEMVMTKLDWDRIEADRRRVAQLEQKIWDRVMQGTSGSLVTPTSGLVISAMNEMFDAQNARDLAMLGRVPKVIVLLLIGASLIAMGTVGCGCGLGIHRNFPGTTIFALLIAAIIWVIFDLDRPLRGVITISQQPLVELQQSIK